MEYNENIMAYTTHDLARDLLKLSDRDTNCTVEQVLQKSKFYKKSKDVQLKEDILERLESGDLTLKNLDTQISFHRRKGQSLGHLLSLVTARAIYMWKKHRGLLTEV